MLVSVIQSKEKKGEVGVNINPVFGIEAPPEIRGPPGLDRYSKEELAAAVEPGKEDMKFRPLKEEEWNEYELADGTRLFLRIAVTRIARTTKFDSMGNPHYITQNTVLHKSLSKETAKTP